MLQEYLSTDEAPPSHVDDLTMVDVRFRQLYKALRMSKQGKLNRPRVSSGGRGERETR